MPILKKRFHFLMALAFLPKAVFAGAIVDPPEKKPRYERDYWERFGGEFNDLDSEALWIDKAQKLIKNGLSEYEEYALRRKIIIWQSHVDVNAQQSLCEKTEIKSDDFLLKSLCISFSSTSYDAKKIELESLFEKTLLKRDGTTEVGDVAVLLLGLYADKNDFVVARDVYEKVMDFVPKDAKRTILRLKRVLADLYSNPSNDSHTLNQALNLYSEIIEELRAAKDVSHSTSFNRGILLLFAFDSYQLAAEDFRQMPGSDIDWMDSRIFLSYSLARLGKKEESLKILKEITLENYYDPKRLPFLKCYMELTRFELGEGQNLSSCVSLPDDTQVDVIFHITKTLSERTLDSPTEVKLWRQFWKLYRDSLAPQMQAQIKDQVMAMELERAKAEAEIKDLELKNFQLIKTLFAITGAALLVNGWFFLRLSSRNRKIERLQRYIHKSVLARFLPPLIVDEIIKGKSRIESKPKEELITVLFSDMVGFTSLSGRLGADGIAVLLNSFMKKMTEVIYSHGGTIDKFIGDAVMVIFGAPLPLPQKEQAEKAVACAKDMISAMEEINLDFKRDYGIEVDMRIGINQGKAIVGTFGSEKRSDYTAIGPMVNLASRIEGKASPHEILVSPEVASHFPAEDILDRGRFKLKGIEYEVNLYSMIVQCNASDTALVRISS